MVQQQETNRLVILHSYMTFAKHMHVSFCFGVLLTFGCG